MKQLSDRLVEFQGEPTIWCPGCQELHSFYVNKPLSSGALWDWNNDVMLPTFKPSMLIKGTGTDRICHSYVTDGEIKFLNDCTHALAGKTVPLSLPDWITNSEHC